VKPSFLAALVEKGIWRKEHGLAYASQVPGHRDRMLSMARLIPLLQEPARTEALNAALEAASWLGVLDRVEAFKALPSGLPRELLAELLNRELATSSSWIQELTIPPLAEKLPEELLQEALAFVCVEPTRERAELLAALVPLASAAEREKLLALALKAIGAEWKESRESRQIKALLRLADFLPAEGKERAARVALEIARGKRPESSEGALLLALTAPLFQGKEQGYVAREALEAALASSDREKVLPILISRLPPPLLEAAEKRVSKFVRAHWGKVELYLCPFAPRWAGQTRRIEDAFSSLEKERIYKWEKGLIVLAPILPEGLGERALRLALEIRPVDEQIAALDAIAHLLSRPQLEKALASTFEIGSGGWSAGVESALLIRFAALGRAEECLDRVRQREWAKGQTLAEISKFLHPALLQDTFEIALQISWAERRCETLAGIAAVAPESERPRLLTAAELSANQARRSFGHRGPLPALRFAMALAMTEPARQLALRKVVAEIPAWAKLRVSSATYEFLVTLAPHLSAPLLRESLAFVGTLKEAYEMPKFFLEVFSRLPETLVTEVLLLNPDLWFPSREQPQEPSLSLRPAAPLAKLCGFLWALVPVGLRSIQMVQNFARECAGVLPGKALSAQVLVAMALSDGSAGRRGLFREAVAAAGRIPSPVLRGEALISLLPLRRDPEIAYRAIAAALAVPETASRAGTFETLSPHLHPYLAARLRRTANTLRRGTPPDDPTDVEALDLLRETGSTAWVRQRLDRISEGRRDLLSTAYEIAKELDERTALRAWALLQLVPYLPPPDGEAVVRNEISKIGSAEAVEHLVTEWGARTSPLLEPIASAFLESISADPFHYSARNRDLSNVLIAAAPHLPDAVLTAAVEKIWPLDDRTRALSALAPRLASLPISDLLSLWQGILRWAAEGMRKDVVAVLEALLPVIERLGGEKALEGVWHVLTSPGASLP
jgi:hypothetical protein